MKRDKPVIKLIDYIEFQDLNVPVYHDSYAKDNYISCSWTARNPDSYYVGTAFLSHETGMVTYRKDAVIPKQTPEDRQQIPKFIVTGVTELTDEFIEKVIEYLTTNYKTRNKTIE